MRHYLLFLLLFIVKLLPGQPFQECTDLNDPYAVLSSLCEDACVICEPIDGLLLNNWSGDQIPLPPPGFCAAEVLNPRWMSFVTFSTDLTLDISVFNCVFGEGLQMALYEIEDCSNFNLIYCTNQIQNNSSQPLFGINLIPGRTYYLVVDGFNNDYCDFTIDVVQGATGAIDISNDNTLIDGPNEMCGGSVEVFTANLPGAGYYEWTVNGAVQAENEQFQVIYAESFDHTIEICVTPYNDCSAAQQTCRDIVVNPIPEIYIYEELCEGEVFHFESSVFTTTGFYQINTINDDGCEQIVFLELIFHPTNYTYLEEHICFGETYQVGNQEFTSSGSYSINLVNTMGCDSIIYLLLTVNPLPSAEIIGPDVACPGDLVTLQAIGGEVYSWNTGQTEPIITVQVDSTELYSVTVTNVDGCNDIAFWEVQAFDLPDVQIMADIDSCTQNPIILTVAGASQYLWSNGQTGNIITILPTSTGTYTVTGTDSNGCSNVDSITIGATLPPDAPIINCTPFANAVEYTWDYISGYHYNVTVLTGQVGVTTDSSILVSNMTQGEEAVVEVIVTNAANCNATSTVSCSTLVCDDPPTVEIAPVDIFCDNDSPISLQVNISNSDGSGIGNWAGPGITDATNGIFDPTIVGPGNYLITYTFEEGICLINEQIQIEVQAVPTAPVATCSSELNSVTYSWSTEPGVDYTVNVLVGPQGQLSGNTYSISNLNPGETTEIEIIASTSAGCSSSTLITCNASICSDPPVVEIVPVGPFCEGIDLIDLDVMISNTDSTGSGIWEGIGIIDPGQGIFDATVAGVGSHLIRYIYEEGICTVEEVFALEIYPLLSAPVINCNAGLDYIDFSWTSGPGVDYYTIEIDGGMPIDLGTNNSLTVDGLQQAQVVEAVLTTYPEGPCEAIIDTLACITLDCADLLSLNVSPDQIFCAGASIQLLANANDATSYNWSPATFLSCTDCPNPIANPATSITYTLVVENSLGCVDSATVSLYQESFPNFDFPNEIQVCYEEAVEFCIPEALSYEWTGPGNYNSTEPCLIIPSMNESNVGVYSVQIEVSPECTFEKSFLLNYEQLPVISTSADTICKGEDVQLSTDIQNAVSYEWSPMTVVSCSNCPEVQATLLQSTNFGLEVEMPEGCIYTVNYEVFVDDECLGDIGTPGNEPSDSLISDPPVQRIAYKNEVLELEVYPNPAKDIFTLSVGEYAWAWFALYDLKGRQIISRTSIEAPKSEIVVEHLDAGLYLLQVLSDKGLSTRKIVVAE